VPILRPRAFRRSALEGHVDAFFVKLALPLYIPQAFGYETILQNAPLAPFKLFAP